ncbi:hypothetical protein [Pseudomonas chlororaphis]|uniref:hypothetical protein n=1 Tax=Pseudomonas chlororaphis TaxID=587753 RepID=UPI000A43F3AC|nr:hypothetical protein [Pseudomonas chlororaphis]
MTIKYKPTSSSKRHPLHNAAQIISEAIAADGYSYDVEADRSTPTGRVFIPKFNYVLEILSKSISSGIAPSFDELKSIAKTLIDVPVTNSKNDLIETCFHHLEEASDTSEEASEKIRKSLVPLFLALLESSNISATVSIGTEKSRLKPLLEGHRVKNSVIKRAKDMAAEMWVKDTDKRIKTSEMADMVWRKLVDEGLSEHLPDNVERVRVWIRGVAPEYAKAKGRPKKRSA